ncbi:MAG: type 1 glutamine amidotransferase [Moraxellaceae bacterium]
MNQTTEPTALRVHFFQHIQGEGLGSLASWLSAHATQVSCTEFFALPPEQAQVELPEIAQVDLLVIMGGAMSVNDEADYSWLVSEKAWIRQYVAQGKSVVGLCLGAQLIASALGATVKRNTYSEIGWWPVQRVAVQSHNTPIFEFPYQLVPLSWHGDTFELPAGAVLLAESAACPHQAYQLGTHVLAFQFHPESTPANARLFAEDVDYQQMVGGQYVQPLAEIVGVSDQQFVAPNQLLERAVEFVLAGGVVA